MRVGVKVLAEFPQVCCWSSLHSMGFRQSGLEGEDPQKHTGSACPVLTRFAQISCGKGPGIKGLAGGNMPAGEHGFGARCKQVSECCL